MQKLDILQCSLLLLIRLDCSEVDELSRAKIKKKKKWNPAKLLFVHRQKQVFLKSEVLEKVINENNAILCNYF